MAWQLPVYSASLAWQLPVYSASLAWQLPVHSASLAWQLLVNLGSLAWQLPVHSASLAWQLPIHSAMAHCSGEGSTRVELSLQTHPTRIVLCSVTSWCCLFLPRLAQMSKPLNRQKMPNLTSVNVALRPDSLTHLFACGIACKFRAVRILSFYNRK